MTRQQKKNLLAVLNVIIFTGSMVTGGAEAMKAALKLGEAVKHLPKKGE